MANRTFNAAKVEIMQGSHGFDNGGDAFGIVLCMTGNNIDAASKVGTANDLTDLTMDEYDGAGYTRPTLGGQTVSSAADSTSVFVDYTDVTFTTLASGSTSIAGVLLYESNSASANDSANKPIAYYDITDINGNGGNLVFAFNSAGALTLA
ncbi:hypothetical protein LCGC14_2475970 [marine sediment metagenome]|uniref:Uncharacterized protein n=1 Tax=marine sediment metagenome TaxID=412755 RepID=A0A0F9E2T1_9ZZZZ